MARENVLHPLLHTPSIRDSSKQYNSKPAQHPDRHHSLEQIRVSLKRRNPQEKKQKPDKLRGWYFVYNLIENNTVEKKPSLEVVLSASSRESVPSGTLSRSNHTLPTTSLCCWIWSCRKRRKRS
ncbi:hypothetical protein RP20_CCG005051 [Aedes albopictus]|nr:hypothetical protein RP20_CCG005051 [Aedes albopictus]